MNENTLKFYKYAPVKKPIFKDKFCGVPFTSIQIDHDGDVQLCSCQLHMPYTIGNIFKESLQTIWNNSQANTVRQSVIDGDFTYCNWACPSLSTLTKKPGILPAVRDFPRAIKLDLDLSCNLKCPSCREQVIIEKNSNTIAKQTELFDEIREWGLANPTKMIDLHPLGSGEMFASHSALKFLESLADYPYNNIRIHIATNGTLLKKNQELLLKINHLIENWQISIDAATPETYEKVRGGNWTELMAGIEIISQLTQGKLGLRFVIQKHNYQEILAFSDLATKLGANKIHYQKLADWGHWTIDWWHNNNVFDRNLETFNQVLLSINTVKNTFPGKISLDAEIIKYLDKFKESP